LAWGVRCGRFFFFFFFLVQAGYVLAFAVTLHRWQARRPPARAVPHHAAARRSEQLPMAAQAGMSDAERQRLTSMLAAGDRFVKASDSKASGCAQSTLSLVCAHLELLACCGVLCSGRLSVWLLLLDISSE
jgi:Flp pilus assembly protein TadB